MYKRQLHGGEFQVPAGRRLVQPLRGHRNTGEPTQDGAQGAGRLPFGREQPAQVAAEFLGQGEEGEGLRGRGEVDDEEAVLLRQRGVAQGAQQGEFLRAGQRGEFLRVEAGGAEEVQCGGGAFLEGGEVRTEVPGGVGAPGGEVRGGFDRGRAGRDAEGGAEGVRRVGGQHEGVRAVGRRGQGGGGREGGTTAAAGAGDQEGAHGGERYPASTLGPGGCATRHCGVRCAHPCRPSGTTARS